MALHADTAKPATPPTTAHVGGTSLSLARSLEDAELRSLPPPARPSSAAIYVLVLHVSQSGFPPHKRNDVNARPESLVRRARGGAECAVESTAVGGAGCIALWETGTARARVDGPSRELLPSKSPGSRAKEPATHHVLQALPHPYPHPRYQPTANLTFSVFAISGGSLSCGSVSRARPPIVSRIKRACPVLRPASHLPFFQWMIVDGDALDACSCWRVSCAGVPLRCIIDTVRCILALKSSGVGFGLPNSSMNAITNTCWFLLTTIADTFIIFRTFVVWNRNWFVIILPTLLCVANFGSSIWLIISLLQFNPDGESVFQNNVVNSTNAFIALTLCTNLICTALISFRIFYVHHQAVGIAGDSPRLDSMKIISAIVESATMYTLLLVAALVCERLGSYINFILFDCTPPTIGLVVSVPLRSYPISLMTHYHKFSYIIIRVSRNTSYGESSVNTATVNLSRGIRAYSSQTLELSQTHNPSFPMGELQVQLGGAMHQHSDLVTSSNDVEDMRIANLSLCMMIAIRPPDGYTIETMPIYGVVDGVETVILPNVAPPSIVHHNNLQCYVGRKDNPSFIGLKPWLTAGYGSPSGHRTQQKDLYNFANAVRELSPALYDKRLFALKVRHSHSIASSMLSWVAQLIEFNLVQALAKALDNKS
ncbi:hypothetical protein B0H19DRAFT_1265012 [Mycena capillaripes]|nr:hypothetical protein B0H19DRAFT_1265012 [Mycena capillaripes]